MPTGIWARTCAAILTCAAVGATASIANAACDNKNALGVERVVEVDTTKGPRLGHVQYKDIDFLRPGEVVLTFDDGPSHQTTPKVLEALRAHCTKGIFFMVGRMAVAYPDMARTVEDAGHTIGSHTWSHKNLARLSSKGAEKEVELGLSAITAALGKPIAPFFRFPYLSDPRRVITDLEARDHAVFSVDVDSYDWKARSTSRMSNNVFSQLEKKGKGIILFHDIQRVTAKGLKSLLDELKRRNYKVVHLVPKTTAATLASYDETAQKLLAKRHVAAANPMTTRSVVWPMSGAIEPSETIARPKGQKTLQPKVASTTDASTGGDGPAAGSDTSSSRSHRRSTRAAPAARSAPRERPKKTVFEEAFGTF